VTVVCSGRRPLGAPALTGAEAPDRSIRLRLAPLLVAVALVATACASSAPSPRPVTPTVLPSAAASAASAAPTPVEQTLTMALDEDPTGRLSNVATGASTRKAAAFLYNGLYGLDEHLDPFPVLAAGPPTVSANGLTWTVRLRDGVHFQDGTALGADDVVQTYAMARSPRCRFNQSLCLFQVLDRVEQVDDLTVAFTLRTKLASFAAVHLGIWIESKDAIDASYGRFTANVPPVAEVGALLDKVTLEESRPTGPDGADGKPTVDYGRFRDEGEGLLRTAGIAFPRESAHTTDGVFDEQAYVRDVIARIRAIDVSFTDRTIDSMAAAYPYLDFQDRPVGTGPFTFDTTTPGDGATFVANEDYFLGEPNIKRLILPIVGSDAEGAQALVDGAIDWDPRIGGQAYEPIKDDADLKFVEYLDLSFFGLYFNLHPETAGLFLDRNLRQAVASCIDRPSTAAAATDGQGVAIYTEIPPISWAYPSDGLETYPLDRDRARELIEASGWTAGSDGIYRKGGRRLATVVAVRAGFPERSRWLQSVSDQVRQCGIDLTYKEVPFSQILGMLEVYPHINAAAPRSGLSFDAYFGGFGVAFDPDPFTLYHSSECSSAERPTTLNYICYANPAVDRLIETGRAEFDQAKRAETYRQYAILQSQDLPVIYAWSDMVREGLRATVDTTDPAGLRLDSPMWARDVEHLTNER
jgi:ABC-type transport system substrate-binding protein